MFEHHFFVEAPDPAEEGIAFDCQATAAPVSKQGHT